MNDFIRENNTVTFMVLAIIFCIAAHGLKKGIQLLINNIKSSIYDVTTKSDICYWASYFTVTNGLALSEIYTQKGKVRANLQNKIYAQMEIYAKILNDNMDNFVHYLYECELLDKNERIKAKEIKVSANKFLGFIKDNVKDKLISGMTPEEFFNIKAVQKGDISGVYIIYNQNKQMYYVGQATRLFFRINQHFTGHGNGDVYADYKYGDKFLIQYINLNGSGYDSLDALEKAKITEYDAYNSGYNKTSGNG